MTRRMPRPVLGAVLAGTMLAAATAGCAEDDAGEARSASAASSSTTPAATARGDAEESGAEEGAFPVTIEHKYGSTTVEDEPERVVAVGLTDIDPLLALDVTPVGFIDWYEDPKYPEGIWPWAEVALSGPNPRGTSGSGPRGTDGTADAEVDLMPRNSDEFLFERIAALKPDLIIGQYTGMTEQEYDLMSEIAPTVAQSGDHADFTMPWQDMTRVIGQAVGRPGRADELIQGVEEAFARVRADHPEFDGAQAIFAERFESGKSYPRGAEEPRVRLLTELGFEIPAEISELAGQYGADLSDERMDLLDTAEVLVWNLYEDKWREDLDSNEVYQGLDVVAEGRDVFMPDVLGGALTWSSVLSLPYALEKVAPLLSAALDGDPDTDAPGVGDASGTTEVTPTPTASS